VNPRKYTETAPGYDVGWSSVMERWELRRLEDHKLLACSDDPDELVRDSHRRVRLERA